MTWLPSPANTLAFRREPDFACVVNLNSRAITYPAMGQVLCASGPVVPTDAGLLVPADAAAWVSAEG
jgi:alpha-glucosidase